MDADVAELVRQERLVEAAELASSRGDPRTASSLFERACSFHRAAEEAVRAEDWARAIPLALEGKRPEAAEVALPGLLTRPAEAERVAFHLERRGDHLWAGRVLEGLGKGAEAARAFERAGEAVRAAKLLEGAGDVASAARVLEAQVRRDPKSSLLFALGTLLFRYGKTDHAVRSLQRIAKDAPERREALGVLVLALDRLGLAQAKVEAEAELDSLGGAIPLVELEGPRSEVRARLFGRYEIVREVASSPHARVLECTDTVRSERVAVKIFAGYDARGAGRDALARFEREVRVLSSLDHPNIVPLRDYVAEGPALVLDWMSHGTLEHMLASEPLTPMRSVEIARAILAALGEAHRLGVIHRDIKPANVLFDDAGVTRLGDFGVAHLSDLTSTATAGVIGTLGYMSPEQREGRAASVRSDLYGVGAILWEMLTGERPEAGIGSVTLRVRPSGVHRDLDARHDALVLSFLSQDPNDRPEDAFTARKALGALRWPDTIERVAPAQRPRSVRPEATTRLLPMEGSIARDQWLDRDVVVVKLDARVLARASAFARADHPLLQAILRVDRGSESIWLAKPRGARLSKKLDASQAALLRGALERLHEAGITHGAIDPEHVVVDEDGELTLCFAPEVDPTATFDVDRLMLARLS